MKRQFKNIRINKIAKNILAKKTLDIDNKDLAFLNEYLSKFNNEDTKNFKALLFRLDLFKTFVLYVKSMDNHNKIMNDLNKELDKIHNEYLNIIHNDYLRYKQQNKKVVNTLNKNINSKLNLIELDINYLLDKLYYANNEDIIIDKDINKISSSDLIAFKISFEDYYNNKFLYYNTLKLFKVYNIDNNYYFVLMLKKTFEDKINSFNLIYKSNEDYYKNNKKSYYDNSYLTYNKDIFKKTNKKYCYLSKKVIRKEYKPYNTKKNNIYSDIDIIINDLDLKFINIINTNLDLDIIKFLKDLDLDLNIAMDNNDKAKLLNKAINYLEYALKLFIDLECNFNYDYTFNYFIDNFNNLINDLDLLIKYEDNFIEYNIYNEYDLSKNNSLKRMSKKTFDKTIDNVYLVNDNNIVTNEDNTYIRIGIQKSN